MKEKIRSWLESISGWKIQRVGKGAVVAFAPPFSSYPLSNFVYTNDLSGILNQYAINLVLDVGANTGQFAQSLRREIGYAGRIISFEPVSSVFEKLQASTANDPAWSAMQCALGSEDSELAINVSESTVFSSFLQSSTYLSNQFGSSSVSSRREQVQVRRLDKYLQELLGPDLAQARIFLKMDTQGFDLEVFAGATGILDRIFVLQSELSAVPIYERMPHLTESLAIYERKGLEVAGIYPLTRDAKTSRAIEYDCLMVRPDAAA